MEVCYWGENGNVENNIKLVERKAFVDCVVIKSADLEDKIHLPYTQVTYRVYLRSQNVHRAAYEII